MGALLTILMILLLLVYLISPYDIIPDFWPIVGWIDDSLVIAILWYWFKRRIAAGGKGNTPHRKKTSTGQDTNQNQKRTETPQEKEAPQKKSPYDILEVPISATPEEIREAYRRKVQAYHPDKVAHLGPELKALAQEKFIEIQKAYEMLRKNK